MTDEGVVCDENMESVTSFDGKKTTNQLDYLQKVILKSVCKHRYASPFLEPVDPVKHNAPDYLDIIKSPMDFGTIRKKLNNMVYSCAQECIEDINLVFSNCYLYNGESAEISKMCKELEESFTAKLTGMPTPEEEMLPNKIVKRKSSDLPPAEIISGKRKISKNFHHLDISSELESQKNKRKRSGSNTGEISPLVAIPPTKNGKPTNNATSASSTVVPTLASKREPRIMNNHQNSRNGIAKMTVAKTVDDDVLIQGGLKQCLTLVRELLSKKYAEFAWPFYHPVDPEKLNLLDYREIIKNPKDLSTIKKRLESNGYAYAHECVSDLRLMLSNCFRYNPPNSDVVSLAKKVQEVIEFYIARLDGDMFSELSTHRPVIFVNDSPSHSAVYGGINGVSHADDALIYDSEELNVVAPRSSQYYSNKSGKGSKSSKNTHDLYSNTHDTSKDKNGIISDALTDAQQTNPLFSMLEDRVKELYEELNKLKSEKDNSHQDTHTTPENSDKKESTIAGNSSTPATKVLENDLDGDDHVPASQSQMHSMLKSEEYAEPMDYDEMRQLTISMNQLPAEKILKVLQIVQQREPELKKMQDIESEVEIDLTQLRPSTLREIQKFVNASLKRRKATATGSSQSTAATQSSSNKKRVASSQNDIAQRREMIEKRLESVKHHFENTSSGTSRNGSYNSISSLSAVSASKTTSNGDISSHPITQTEFSCKPKSVQYSTLSEDSDSETEFVDTKQTQASTKSISQPNNHFKSPPTLDSTDETVACVLDDTCPVILPEVVSNSPTLINEDQKIVSAKSDDSSNLMNIPDNSTSPTSNSLPLVQKMKQEEERRRMAMVGRIDMNAQRDLLHNFEENHL